MIEYAKGDILKAQAEALVNTVNCVGVMGRGIALQFRKAFPENFKEYQAICRRGELRIGKPFIHSLNSVLYPRYVVNFPTKKHWRESSRIEFIEEGLIELKKQIILLGIRSIAIPPLGCGLGGLDWNMVRPLIEKAFESLPEVRVLLFAPSSLADSEKIVSAANPPVMTVGRAVLLELMRQYLSALMDPFVSLLELHKLMYFMQESGEALKLRYRKGIYGPYAENLGNVLTRIDGYFITGYGDAEDKPDKPIELNQDAANQAQAFLKDHPSTLSNLREVSNLIAGFETQYGMELLSTVHWLAVHEGVRDVESVVKHTYAWNKRKEHLKEEHIRLAWEILGEKAWLSALAEK